ncbi:MAG: 2-amino-4-hydroxy-6-hydroxymethyldihydropteridine diphosphokinase [Fusobacterium mortiferum]|uniref:Bifunctional folate synthesis protein n=1 Tax=Fusobacterium mortiferum ATCC 9817 TaxID=469616 RepID=A0ABM6TTI1_FUSMR|nr:MULTISPECIES: 2-amino-4-hydroxy-6-hydroxymethyldihydropteridine diphosphokinase [Fusobacterium]AVQ17780.1 2-amino-4-hydroxy-6-hydroxymethyldihydropteridine diphosphokinase [Fusobacterium mortiferum ATCC 9817]EEO36529.2 2-amino-4-hydroxy-6-hydroxymethyldihydropteridine diphosphokinase [Fusobacterium mortiferum ATCC 9817]MCF2626900.1 2-amino-4-hydroxy-6-hydroxymethyldihydropteridine diphosphokinase [Fusobacterium mortiferum]MCF2698837.1 2-amino-4-hydroxy-6-hydroxymethyldihydropteridine diphosp
MDKIYINNLEFIGFHGVFSEEKKLGQKFLVSLELTVDTREAGKTGDLTKSVHYGLVAQDVEKLFLEKSIDLIETCAENIAEMVLKKYELVKEVKVIVKKPWAPLQMHFENVAVEITRKWHRVYLSLGSNIGNKRKNLLEAIRKIGELENTEVVKSSTILETEPFGYLEQDNFLNACLEVKTLMTAQEFLKEILQIELDMGRVREIKWGPRIIDIDILFYDKEIIEEDNLAVPHPWICEREFVLDPLSEIAPNYIHPLEKKTITMLARKLKEREANGN